jgi:hypothetical protein
MNFKHRLEPSMPGLPSNALLILLSHFPMCPGNDTFRVMPFGSVCDYNQHQHNLSGTDLPDDITGAMSS